jgi:hypothetical protein
MSCEAVCRNLSITVRVALFLFLISLFLILEETKTILTRLKKDVSKKRV